MISVPLLIGRTALTSTVSSSFQIVLVLLMQLQGEYFCQSEIDFILTKKQPVRHDSGLDVDPVPVSIHTDRVHVDHSTDVLHLCGEFLMVLFCALLVQVLLKPFQIEKQKIEIDKGQHLLLGVSVSKTTAIPNEVDQESPELKHHCYCLYVLQKK